MPYLVTHLGYSLRHHKPTQRGFVYKGKRHYLGHWPRDKEKPPLIVEQKFHDKCEEFLKEGKAKDDLADPSLASEAEPHRAYHGALEQPVIQGRSNEFLLFRPELRGRRIWIDRKTGCVMCLVFPLSFRSRVTQDGQQE